MVAAVAPQKATVALATSAPTEGLVVGIILSLVFGGLGRANGRSRQRFEFTRQGDRPGLGYAQPAGSHRPTRGVRKLRAAEPGGLQAPRLIRPPPNPRRTDLA